jgi:hypothetical protein
MSKKRALLDMAFLERSSKSRTRFSLISMKIGSPPALEIEPGTGARVYILVKTFSPALSPAALRETLIA